MFCENDIWITVLRTSVALVVWYPTMDCICMHSFFLSEGSPSQKTRRQPS